MKRKLLLFFCVLSCVLMVSGCSLVRGNENFDKKTLEQQTDSFLNNWFSFDFDSTIATYKDQMDETTLAQYKLYAKQKKQYKGLKKKTEYTITTDSATVTETILCESGDKLLASLTFDKDGQIQTDDSGNYSFKFDEYKTLGQKMQKAGLNTIMSMSIVFLVLIFISLLISCFKFIGLIGKGKADKSPVAVAAAPAAPVSEPEDLTDDLELVAVITAAIAAASETESADGLVVRSIIRR
jgi:sodium pump decarboxylase gamma subunit